MNGYKFLSCCVVANGNAVDFEGGGPRVRKGEGRRLAGGGWRVGSNCSVCNAVRRP